MKYKMIRGATLLAAIITIISSLSYLYKKIMIPGLGPLSLAIVMFGLVYSSKHQYSEGKISRQYWRFMFYVGLLGGILNIFAGISQIMVAVSK
ncbi:hypothetical protein [Alkaliphilus hydrothermalis]|uniref:Uncharacterized protein n=1 Tax=Alkaliphilus hydrothermalis TaxID=1482730 RepID=A0ABS2NLJ0_9FIRM|nr:hypothetical protein [Alkaliphilus hydrothermalis]MBM7613781.1 hypothetical protein [Alkaliphilus hydrothermalis]